MNTKKYTSASDLAAMGYCEKKMLFESRLGKRVSNARAAARLRGQEAHAAFHHDAQTTTPSVDTSEAKPWCFIATELFGHSAPETRLLRLFRDKYLRPNMMGRWLIIRYYRHGFVLSRWFRAHPWAKGLLKAVLRAHVRVLLRSLDREGQPFRRKK